MDEDHTSNDIIGEITLDLEKYIQSGVETTCNYEGIQNI